MKALLFLLLLAFPSFAAAQAQKKAPALTLRDLRGRRVSLRDYAGKVVLLNFWATWCAPCRAEVPDLIKWQRDYGGRGLQVVGVAQPPASRAAVRAFARRYHVNYPVLIGTSADKALFIEGETLPVSVLIDREGEVRAVIEGIILPDEFEEKIMPLLDPPHPAKQGAPVKTIGGGDFAQALRW